MVGRCEQCRKEYVKPAPTDTTTCHCRSTVLIPLKPALELTPTEQKRLIELATKFGSTIPELVGVALSLGLRKIKRMKVEEVITYG